MTRTKKSDNGRPIDSYAHADKKRLNNPPVGLVTPEANPDKRASAFDPRLEQPICHH